MRIRASAPRALSAATAPTSLGVLATQGPQRIDVLPIWFALDRGTANEHDLGEEVAQRGCGESSSSTFTRRAGRDACPAVRRRRRECGRRRGAARPPRPVVPLAAGLGEPPRATGAGQGHGPGRERRAIRAAIRLAGPPVPSPGTWDTGVAVVPVGLAAPCRSGREQRARAGTRARLPPRAACARSPWRRSSHWAQSPRGGASRIHGTSRQRASSERNRSSSSALSGR